MRPSERTRSGSGDPVNANSASAFGPVAARLQTGDGHASAEDDWEALLAATDRLVVSAAEDAEANGSPAAPNEIPL
jgi:hypothetical protein